MNPADANAFTNLSLIAAPAVLTNASSVLVLSTGNRLARAVDRARALSSELGSHAGHANPLAPLRLSQLGRTERRAILLLAALRLFYLALGSFAAATLTSLLGAIVTPEKPWLYRGAEIIAALAGLLGVGGIIVGTGALVRETRLAVESVSEEAATLRAHFRDLHPVESGE
jgi:hypothetical protein